MENQKNLFLAIAISMAIIFGFQLIIPQPEPTNNTISETSNLNELDITKKKTNIK